MSFKNTYKLTNLLLQLKAKVGHKAYPVVSMLNDLPVGIAFVSHEGIIESANVICSQVLKSPNKKIENKPLIQFVSEEMNHFINHLQEKIFDAQQFYVGKFNLKLPNTTTFNCLGAAFPTQNRKGEAQMLLILLPDEQIEQAEQRLFEALHLIDQYTENLQDELKTLKSAENLFFSYLHKPLDNISDIAHLLMQEKLHDRDLKALIESIQQISWNTQELLHRFSSLQRMEKGDFYLQYEEFDLLALIEEINKLYFVKWSRKALQIDVNLHNKELKPSDEFLIVADQTFIKMMYLNLLLNAIEASPKIERISIDIRQDQEQLSENFFELTIYNKGLVSQSDQKSFFKTFDAPGKPFGLAVGTYLAHSVALAHQGSIHMDSSAKAGTSVSVRLPLRPLSVVNIDDQQLRKQLLEDD